MCVCALLSAQQVFFVQGSDDECGDEGQSDLLWLRVLPPLPRSLPSVCHVASPCQCLIHECRNFSRVHFVLNVGFKREDSLA